MNNQTQYQQQLAAKHQHLSQLLQAYWQGEIVLYPSPPEHYRMRAEFRLWHDEQGCHYAMSPAGEKMHRDNVIKLTQFPAACASINAMMPRLLAALNANPILSQKLFQVEFLATLAGDMLISLIYHRRLAEAWQAAASVLQNELQVAIIGRSRGQKVVLTRDFVREMLRVQGRDYHYVQIEQSFSQPNAQVCEKMLAWACEQVPLDYQHRDLLELYCGNGNFTLPLSQHFRCVLATEISKSGISALRQNLALNHIDNIAVARLSAEEFAQAWQGEREFQRLKQDDIVLSDYDFACAFVDPPRAGIDENTLQLLSGFEQIIYISCNPHTLVENLAILSQTHEVSAAALFDQFPFTPHIESGVLLRQRR